MSNLPASAHSAFFWRDGTSVIGESLAKTTAAKKRSSDRIEKAREEGKDLSTIRGISAKSEAILNDRKRYSPMVEGAAAGQKSADRRDAIRRGGR